MPSIDEISFTTTELRSVLPLGWSVEPDSARWDPERQVWQATLRDVSKLAWPVRVSLAEAQAAGRLEALRRATQAAKRQRRS